MSKQVHRTEAEIGDDRVRIDLAVPAMTAPVSARLVEVGLRFGVALTVPGREIVVGVHLEIRPGTVTLVTGPSGSGKSLLLSEVGRQYPLARLLHNVPFPRDVAVLDAVLPSRPVAEALGLLTACGLGETSAWLRRFEQLSQGEQYRALLARAIGLQRGEAGPAPLLCDEFGSVLHARAAKALAFNLGKLARRERLAVVVATSRDDLEDALAPDTVVRLGGDRPVIETGERNPRTPGRFMDGRLRIEAGTLADYASLSAMHYRQNARIGFVDRVFICREGVDGPTLGVVVYGRPSLELQLRNQVTGKRFCHNAGLLNDEMRVLKRLVIHPDVRGCGLGHRLVRETLPLAGTRFVECLAAMGVVNPVFEKAGMRRMGVCRAPASREAVLRQLRAAGADPCDADFVSQVCRRPEVRGLVTGCVRDWYRGVCGHPDERLAKQSPAETARTFRQLAGSEPVYYLWAADKEGWAVLEQSERAGAA